MAMWRNVRWRHDDVRNRKALNESGSKEADVLCGCCSLLLLAEESARVHAATFVPAVEELIVKVLALYEGTTMPASDIRFLPSSA